MVFARPEVPRDGRPTHAVAFQSRRAVAAAGRHGLRGERRRRIAGHVVVAGLLRRHLQPPGLGQRRDRDRGGLPRAAGRAVGRHGQRAARVPAPRRGGDGGGGGAHGARLRHRRPGGRILPLRRRQVAGRRHERALRDLARDAARRGGGAERRHGRDAGGPAGAAGHARLLRRPRAGPAHPGRGGADRRRADAAAANATGSGTSRSSASPPAARSWPTSWRGGATSAAR